MSIPILGTASTTRCVVCGGFLTPQHEHVYIDKDMLSFYDKMIEGMLTNGCLLINPETGDIFYGHPLLKETHAWGAVKVTHTGPHDTCNIIIPHHHCKEE